MISIGDKPGNISGNITGIYSINYGLKVSARAGGKNNDILQKTLGFCIAWLGGKDSKCLGWIKNLIQLIRIVGWSDVSSKHLIVVEAPAELCDGELDNSS